MADDEMLTDRSRSHHRSPSPTPRRTDASSPRRELSPRRERDLSPRRGERDVSPRRERDLSPRRDTSPRGREVSPRRWYHLRGRSPTAAPALSSSPRAASPRGVSLRGVSPRGVSPSSSHHHHQRPASPRGNADHGRFRSPSGNIKENNYITNVITNNNNVCVAPQAVTGGITKRALAGESGSTSAAQRARSPTNRALSPIRSLIRALSPVTKFVLFSITFYFNNN